MDFFTTSKLYIVVYHSLVTLTPNSYDANTINDMRSIFYYIIIYKVILKILTTILGK